MPTTAIGEASVASAPAGETDSRRGTRHNRSFALKTEIHLDFLSISDSGGYRALNFRDFARRKLEIRGTDDAFDLRGAA